MSRVIDKPIDPPVLDAQRQPLYITWRRSRYKVDKVLDTWMEIGRWWEQESEVKVWRIQTFTGATLEVGQETGGQRRWRLFKIYD